MTEMEFCDVTILYGIVKEAPRYSSQGSSIPFSLETIDSLGNEGHPKVRRLQSMKDKTIEVRCTSILPVCVGDRLKIYGPKLEERQDVIVPTSLNILDEKGEIKAQYYQI